MQYLDYRERRTHGSPVFPAAFYRVGPGHPRYEMAFHWHVECELIRIVSGSLALVLDDERLTVSAGDLVFVNSGVLHAGVPSDCVYECLVFDLDRLLRSGIPFVRGLSEGQIRVLPMLSGNADVNTAAMRLFDEASCRGAGFELMLQGSLCHILGMVTRDELYTSGSSVSRQSKRILQFKKALLLIEEGYQSSLPLSRLAGAAGMSPKYFCRFFSQMTGHTPIDYLNRHRIEQACRRLVSTDLSITEIAFECGFGDLSYFIRTFKKYKGVSPGGYLRQEAGKQ